MGDPAAGHASRVVTPKGTTMIATATPTEPASASDQQLERHRPHLRLLAEMTLPRKLGAKLDASDLVQQTLLQAHRAMGEYRGQSERELAGWLRQILTNVLCRAIRDMARGKRDVDREVTQQQLAQRIDRSTVAIEMFLHAQSASPSQAVDRQERITTLAQAIEQLPEPQRQAVVLHHLQGWSLQQIGAALDKSPAAVAGLLYRALKQLRDALGGAEPTVAG